MRLRHCRTNFRRTSIDRAHPARARGALRAVTVLGVVLAIVLSVVAPDAAGVTRKTSVRKTVKPKPTPTTRRPIAGVAVTRPAASPAATVEVKLPPQIDQPSAFVGVPAATVAAPSPRTSTPNVANRFVVIGLGDSYAAGEGAPVKSGQFDASGWQTGAAEEWVDSSLGTKAIGDKQCHRSDSSTSGQVVAELRRAYPALSISFASFACSGAVANVLLDASYRGSDPDLTTPVPPQLEQARQWLESGRISYTWEGRQVVLATPEHPSPNVKADAAILSIGGNDAGFPWLVLSCSVVPGCWNGGGLANEFRAGRTAEPMTFPGLGSLAGSYDRLATAMAGLTGSGGTLLGPTKVYITQYPDPSWRTATQRCVGTETRLSGDFLGGIDADESDKAITNLLQPLNDAVASAAQRNAAKGWVVIGGHLPLFKGHGVCSDTPFMNTNRDALAKQGAMVILTDTQRAALVGTGALLAAVALGPLTLVTGGLTLPVFGSLLNQATALSGGMMHPNTAGYKAYADAVLPKLREQVDAKFAPVVPTDVRQDAAVADGDITIGWNDRGATEVKYVVTGRRLSGFGADFITELPAETTGYAHKLTSGAVFEYRVKACTITGACAEAASIAGTNIRATPATALRVDGVVEGAGYLSPVTFSWALNGGQNMRSVIQVRPVGGTGAVEELIVDGPTRWQYPQLQLVARGSTDVSTTRTLAARVWSCNPMGCAGPSNELRFTLVKPPSPVTVAKPELAPGPGLGLPGVSLPSRGSLPGNPPPPGG